MSVFWLITAVLLLVALGFVLWPLLRRSADPFVGQAAQLRAQLHTLELAERDGLLSTVDATARRERLKSELLSLLDQPAAGKNSSGAPSRMTVLVLAAVIPLLTVVLYRQFGTPHALLFSGVTAAPAATGGAANSAAANSSAGNTQGPDLRAAAEALALRLADRPDDAEGWTLLARTWQELGEFAQARDAFAKVYAIKSDDPEVISDYAQALGLASDPRSLLGQPRELLEKALKINPQHQRSMWLYGYSLRQAGELPATLELWNRLLAQMPEGSPEAVSLTEQINVVRSELGQAALPVPGIATAAPPAATPMATPANAASASANDAADAAPSAGLRVQVVLDPALADQVAAGDVLYIFARAESGPAMPLAIQRVAAGQLPLTVTLTDAMAMTPAMKLSSFPKVIVGARVSKSGNATAASGDLQGFSSAITQPYGDEVRVLINAVVP
jgi:cytochrome c-type biogenesis protein CcmH